MTNGEEVRGVVGELITKGDTGLGDLGEDFGELHFGEWHFGDGDEDLGEAIGFGEATLSIDGDILSKEGEGDGDGDILSKDGEEVR